MILDEDNFTCAAAEGFDGRRLRCQQKTSMKRTPSTALP